MLVVIIKSIKWEINVFLLSIEYHGEVTPIITANSSPKQKQTPQNFKLGNGPVTFVRANKIPSTVPSNPNLAASASNPQLNTLDEITNKVFNELLQGKVDGQGMVNGVNGNIRTSEQGSIKVCVNIIRFVFVSMDNNKFV